MPNNIISNSFRVFWLVVKQFVALIKKLGTHYATILYVWLKKTPEKHLLANGYRRLATATVYTRGHAMLIVRVSASTTIQTLVI